MDQKRNRKTPSWCGSRKRKAARTPYDARITEYAHQGHLVPPRSILKTPEQIVGIRESGKINIAVLDHVAAHIKAGMTTAEIDRLVFEKTRELGGVPAPLGYRGFPKSTCTSINEEVCHGIPADDVALKDGDGVRGVVPQRLLKPEGEAQSVQVMFRPAGVYENATLCVMDGDREILRQRKRILTPGEMAELTLKPEQIASLSGADVTVCVKQ